jgi:hypothetical protein
MALRGQTSLNPQEYYGPYDYVGVSINQLQEGDEVVTADLETYIVMQASVHPFTRNDLRGGWTVAVLVKRFPLATLRTLTLGAADATTGLYAVSYVSSSIYAQIFNPNKSTIKTPAGYYGKYGYAALTSAAVLEGDQLTDANSVTYEVQQVTSYPTSRTDISLRWYVLGLVKRDFADQPATSGTWHLDSSSVKTDPRNRQKILIDTYLTAANVKKDDGTTNASTATCFDGATYPIPRLFLTQALDAIAVISRKPSEPIYTDKLLGHKPYAFNEQVEIEIYAVNKSGVTASNLVEKYEQEIRRIYTTYDAYANVRDLDTITPSLTDLGYAYLCKTGISINYKRNNDDYTAALPTITYGDSQGTTYYFPNATEIRIIDPDTGDALLTSPGRLGDILQILGGSDIEIQITADLDVDAAGNKRWKRPQTTGAITDTVPWQVFTEIKFGNKTSANQIYQNLNWGGGTTIPVRLTDLTINGSFITLTFRRYSASNGSSSTSKVWYGIS